MSYDDFLHRLEPAYLKTMNNLIAEVEEADLIELILLSRHYLNKITEASKDHPLINARLAAAIHDKIEKVADEVSSTSENLTIFKAAILYFIIEDDDENDFDSPIGFEDDATVINTFLEHIGRDDLLINIGDFDEY